MTKSNKLIFRVEPQVYIGLALWVLIIPLRWLISWFVAIIIHETGHCLAVCFFGKKIHSISVNPNGAVIQTQSMTNLENFACALAGPVVGALPIIFSSAFPRIALCAFVLTIYNIIPVYPLDGGRLLHTLTESLFTTEYACCICKVVEWLCLGVAITLALWAYICWNIGIFPLVLVVMFLVKTGKIKIPCKPGHHRVQ